MVFKDAQNNLIRGMLPGVVPSGIISLQYADDTILFLENNINMAQNIKWLLTCFEEISRMHINYHKSDLLTINLPTEDANLFA
jgi:hypothetical protein